MKTDPGKKLLIVTEAVDPSETNLGFFCNWIRELSVHPSVGSIDVWCLREGVWPDRPANVRVRVLPRFVVAKALVLLYRVLTTRVDTVFVHMAPIWAALFGPWWRLTGQRVILWYTHGSTSLTLRIACHFVSKVATATDGAFPVRDVARDVLGHGIDPAFFAVTHHVSPTSSPKIVSVGRLTSRKRALETVSLFARMKKEIPSATFTWIGSPRSAQDRVYEKEVQQKIVSLGLSEAVRLQAGIPHSELPPILASSDLLLHLSDTGSLDKVVLESLAAGCPVFSTNPATQDVGQKWYWKYEIDAEAVDRAIACLHEGVLNVEKKEIENRFALPRFIDRLVRASLFPSA
jgi:glycosyltransferase involved in cell wall biosynthesis